MHFSQTEWATILAALHQWRATMMLAENQTKKIEAALAGAATRPADINALIERIEQERQS
jgi:hypothetical protein